MHSTAIINLPRNAVLHYLSTGDESIGIEPNDPLLVNYKDPIGVSFVVKQNEETLEGRAIKTPTDVKPLLNDYFKQNKTFKRLDNNMSLVNNERVLLVYNYGLLNTIYAYPKLPVAKIHRWRNGYRAMLDKCVDVSATSTRQHYLVMQVPYTLLPVSVLDKTADMTEGSVLKRINTFTDFIIADCWNWLGFGRDHSVLGSVNDEALNRINLVLVHAGLWTVVNLGMLNSWRYTDPKFKAAPGFQRIAPDVINRRFLRMLMTIAETTTVVPDKGHYEAVDKSLNAKQSQDDDSTADSQGTGEPVSLGDNDISFSGKQAPSSGPTGGALSASVVSLINQGVSDSVLQSDNEIINDIGETDDNSIDDDLSALERLEVVEVNVGDYKAYEAPNEDLTRGVTDAATKALRMGKLSAAEYRRFEKLASRFKDIKDPTDPNAKLSDVINIAPELLALEETNMLAPDIKGVLDKSMLSCSTKEMDKRYIRKVMRKDVASMVVNLQNMGFAVQDYNIEKVEDYTDNLEIHSIKIIPVIGKPTTLRFKLPVVNDDGTFKAGAVKYRMRKQRGDCPIRKTAHDTVALTSYYSKMFVTRSSRAVFNRANWLVDNIIARGIDIEDKTVTDLRMNNVFNSDLDLPRTYSTIARRISGFQSGPYLFSFDYAKHETILSGANEKLLADIKGKNELYFPVGTSKTEILVMDKNDTVYALDTTEPTLMLKQLGTIEDIIGLDMAKSPMEVAEVGIFGKEIPVGFILAHHIGLGNLLKTLGVEYQLLPIGSRYGLDSSSYIVRFEDMALILKRSDRLAALLLAGFNRYHREIKRYSFYAFDKPEVYNNILDENGLSARYIREFDIIFKLWVDPITRGLLTDMDEPTDVFNLFISACKKLLTDAHPDQMDMAYMRDKGYERFSGMLYFELIKAVRGYSVKPANANASLDLNPEAVWMSILQDQTVMPIEESNPVHALKEKEVVVYSGAGGRSGRSMTEKSRVYHKNSMGVVSEATVDSGDVATITYLTADPNYTSLRGTSRRITDTKGIASKLVSTSMLLAPGADMDDPKRVNFTSVQNSQTTFCKAYTPTPCRTGYERVIAHRQDPLYAKTADNDGVVESVDDKVVRIKYNDGETISYEIGLVVGTWAGNHVPHQIVSDLKKGQKVAKNDIICYNRNYFERDRLDPSQLTMKMSLLGRVVLLESTDTLEDSSAISEALAERLGTKAINIRTVRVDFNQEVRNLLQVGEIVEPESILCTIHSATEGASDLFDDEALKTLSIIDTPTPKAKYAGAIEKIEVLYTGELDDMSASLRHLAELSDRDLRRFNKSMGRKAIDGRVEVGYRVDSKQMELDSAVIRVYVNSNVGMSGGDKIVFANQMKSVSCRVMSGVNKSADGKPFDGIFGQQSITNRIAESPILMGTAGTLSVLIGELMVKAFRGK